MLQFVADYWEYGSDAAMWVCPDYSMINVQDASKETLIYVGKHAHIISLEVKLESVLEYRKKKNSSCFSTSLLIHPPT